MLVVDSSVWIAVLRGIQTEAAAKLLAHVSQSSLIVGDVILLELLQGVRDAQDAMRIERRLRGFPLVAMLSLDLAIEAAANYRQLRGLGITIRKVPDLIIGTYCIEHNHSLLHDDRDFEPMREHLGLRVT